MRLVFAILLVLSACGSRREGQAPKEVKVDHRRGLTALEHELSYGSSWGNDPTAKKVAAAVADVLVKDMMLPRSEVAVAVQRAGKSSVAVIKLKYLKDESREDRKDLAYEIFAALSEGLRDGDTVVFGIRGALLYGLVAWGTVGDEVDMKVGKAVATERLEKALE